MRSVYILSFLISALTLAHVLSRAAMGYEVKTCNPACKSGYECNYSTGRCVPKPKPVPVAVSL